MDLFENQTVFGGISLISSRMVRFSAKILVIINIVLLIFRFRIIKVIYQLKKYGKMEPDYVRFSTLYLLSLEINKKGLEGDVAELGVYRGDFAKNINQVFPDRTLYLFDTFEGFVKRDVNIDKSFFYSECDQDFSATNIDLVMKKMKHPEKCKVIKGYFPDSLNKLPDNEKMQYCFVSIDADLYQPTYEGLCYFYPHLCKGGYIMVHDYNNVKYKGVYEAVLKFTNENPASYVPLGDPSGSVVIVKI